MTRVQISALFFTKGTDKLLILLDKLLILSKLTILKISKN